jgi:hypothetical protein
MTKANYGQDLAIPVIRGLQPWMIPLGIYVAHEDFWNNEDISIETP